MYRLMALALSLAVVVALSGDAALAKGKKGGGAPKAPKIPAGYSKVESLDTAAKTFKLTDDPKNYKYTDTTFNKELLYVGAVVKVTLKDGSADEVTVVDKVPPKEKKKGGGGKGKGKGKKK